MSLQGQTWWLVGASEGLGRALAEAMSIEGATLILSARNSARLVDLAETLPDARALAVDVTDDASVTGAAAEVGTVDGVIFLAGTYWPMRAQEWDTGKALAMIDVNLLGAMRVVGAVLPGMLARNSGRLVLTGSLAGFRGLPGSIGYGASKAGLMNLAQSLQVDLQATGVRVQLINPGFIRTRLTAKNSFAMPFIQDPEQAAAEMMRALNSGRPMTSFPRVFSWLFRAGRLFPTALWNRIFAQR
ncbi:SDR family NAD(P)-dependent oxidoreductase [Pararhodobacter zhoushanensis]|uniref:SDR family NAD(P)-dependent oxidoreductase n=1 Tax=Pararhodobacter zhoushanensis TaxID=2479545 RepID=A0ABT3GUY8_9RHOB|nr:SDR family NAD(P)-dependent oxidoreductase [Pararhodobacter zhoushanensis]MCW1931347.1 SDR family NAD(P)-dependent oxidoreductase [Pararhodobacter zhoushanensis]